MDPDANLREQLEIARGIVHAEWDGTDATEHLERLAELVIALDEWLCKGGFRPARWGHPNV